MYTSQQRCSSASDAAVKGKCSHALHHRSNIEKLTDVSDQWRAINHGIVQIAREVYRTYPFVITPLPPAGFDRAADDADARDRPPSAPGEVHALGVYLQVYTLLASHMTIDSGIDAAEEEANSDISERASVAEDAAPGGGPANYNATLNFYFGISYNLHYDPSHFVEQLVWRLLWSWYRQLSAASGGRLRLPPELAAGGGTAPPATRCARRSCAGPTRPPPRAGRRRWRSCTRRGRRRWRRTRRCRPSPRRRSGRRRSA
ncbi:hypothetical protein STCU_11935 [Strigomonas culicis]|uniref:Uncharacterized protein n=1 Tax=Strigomonas culicis TaxID=28005 RepID=S9TC28_9TRYP|nr:hypothetical protein STCU_11935 [Strigomonas culicis]|eukprot:EPY15552.1 hypothetical protein STCU_11935 [Strigomonas culicis]